MPILSQLRKNENAALAVGGVTYYNTLDSLPITGLTSGDQAFVSATERYYVSDGNGWFNTTLINKNIRWDSGGEPSAEAEITDSATPLIIIARAADSDQSVFLNQSFASDSAQYMATVTNDSSVFTFTPKTAAQIGASVAAGELSDSNGDFIYTFKWSDGLSFVNKAVTITYNPAGGGGGSGVPYGARAVIYNSASGSSSNHSNTIDYFTIATPGNSASFGNMLGTTVNGGSAHNVTVSNGSRIVYGAFYDRQMIAGVLNIMVKEGVALAFYISHKEDFQELRPLNLLFFDIFKWSLKNNIKVYDFGTFTDKGIANMGLGRFKESFGASGVFRDSFKILF